MKEEKFPLQYIASKPVTTQQAIQKWFERRTESTQSTE
jgi:hypothetical protein